MKFYCNIIAVLLQSNIAVLLQYYYNPRTPPPDFLLIYANLFRGGQCLKYYLSNTCVLYFNNIAIILQYYWSLGLKIYCNIIAVLLQSHIAVLLQYYWHITAIRIHHRLISFKFTQTYFEAASALRNTGVILAYLIQ